MVLQWQFWMDSKLTWHNRRIRVSKSHLNMSCQCGNHIFQVSSILQDSPTICGLVPQMSLGPSIVQEILNISVDNCKFLFPFSYRNAILLCLWGIIALELPTNSGGKVGSLKTKGWIIDDQNLRRSQVNADWDDSRCIYLAKIQLKFTWNVLKPSVPYSPHRINSQKSLDWENGPHSYSDYLASPAEIRLSHLNKYVCGIGPKYTILYTCMYKGHEYFSLKARRKITQADMFGKHT